MEWAPHSLTEWDQDIRDEEAAAEADDMVADSDTETGGDSDAAEPHGPHGSQQAEPGSPVQLDPSLHTGQGAGGQDASDISGGSVTDPESFYTFEGRRTIQFYKGCMSQPVSRHDTITVKQVRHARGEVTTSSLTCTTSKVFAGGPRAGLSSSFRQPFLPLFEP